MIVIHLISIFPEVLKPYLATSILGRAARQGLIRFELYDLKKYAERVARGRPTRRLDDRSFGGGPGMVLRAEPILRAVAMVRRGYRGARPTPRVIIFSPAGKQFDNQMARRFARTGRDLILIAGRYEGIDARVKKILRAELISIGPYVLSGGEVPALVLADALTRQLPGVLGDPESLEEKRTASPEVYTRPALLNYNGKRYRVPKVLLSGHHAEIDNWRQKQKSKVDKH